MLMIGYHLLLLKHSCCMHAMRILVVAVPKVDVRPFESGFSKLKRHMHAIFFSAPASLLLLVFRLCRNIEFHIF